MLLVVSKTAESVHWCNRRLSCGIIMTIYLSKIAKTDELFLDLEDISFRVLTSILSKNISVCSLI